MFEKLCPAHFFECFEGFLYIIDYQMIMFELNFLSFRKRQKIGSSVKFLFWAKISFCHFEKTILACFFVVFDRLLTHV